MKEEMLRALLQKKAREGKMISGPERDAKMSVLHDFKDQMGGMMGDKLKGMSKVSVASDSPEGLGEGLDTAKDLVSTDDGSEGAEGSPEEEQSEQPEDKMLEEAQSMSAEELDSVMQKLQMLKDQKSHEGSSHENM